MNPFLGPVWEEIRKIQAHPAERPDPEWRLGADLHLPSMAWIRLMGRLRQRYPGVPLPFEKLLANADGTWRSDLRLIELADFLGEHVP